MTLVTIDVKFNQQVIVILFSNGEQTIVPFSWFEPNAKYFPNFNDVEITDDGLTLRLGDYEVASDRIARDFIQR